MRTLDLRDDEMKHEMGIDFSCHDYVPATAFQSVGVGTSADLAASVAEEFLAFVSPAASSYDADQNAVGRALAGSLLCCTLLGPSSAGNRLDLGIYLLAMRSSCVEVCNPSL